MICVGCSENVDDMTMSTATARSETEDVFETDQDYPDDVAYGNGTFGRR